MSSGPPATGQKKGNISGTSRIPRTSLRPFLGVAVTVHKLCIRQSSSATFHVGENVVYCKILPMKRLMAKGTKPFLIVIPDNPTLFFGEGTFTILAVIE
jgi:hypothetical protein